jgi:anti-sigma factor RsiW
MSDRDELTCRDVAEFLADYVSDELRAEVRSAFDAHLAECPECAAYVESYATTIRLAHDALCADDAVPTEVPASLVRAIVLATRRR